MMLRQLFGLKTEDGKQDFDIQLEDDSFRSEEDIAKTTPDNVTAEVEKKAALDEAAKKLSVETEAKKATTVEAPPAPATLVTPEKKPLKKIKRPQPAQPTATIAPEAATVPAPDNADSAPQAAPVKVRRRKKCEHHRLFSKKKEGDAAAPTTANTPLSKSGSVPKA